MKSAILFISLILCSRLVQAQSDYVVSLKGDTLFGDIAINSRSFYDEVSVKNESGRETIKSFAINIVKIGDERYRPISYQNKKTLVQIVVEGTSLSGYKVKPEGSYEYTEDILVKANGEMLFVSKISFRRRINEFLEDCEPVTTRIENKELGYSELTQIISLYNKSCGEDTDLPAFASADSGDAFTDALAVISDVIKKLDAGESIPSYQLEALRRAANVDLNAELEQLIKSAEQAK